MVNHKVIAKVYQRLITDHREAVGPCCLCQAPAPLNQGLCRVCAAAMPALSTPLCRCGLPRADRLSLPPEHNLCGPCIRNPPHFSHTSAAYFYESPLSGLIQHYKRHRQLHFERPLLALWRQALALRPPLRPDVLVPLPCHWRRHWRRGFSPAARLARGLGRGWRLPVLTALVRRRATPSQQGRSAAARRANVRASMSLDMDVEGLHLALVDDVMTTGASAREASRVLFAAGAARVDVWVLARTPEQR